mmetsp:Transcript_8892/g.13093  ORF Transcript_8892/g.13093 Transcript_8892/m.13093 type:complete len:90 (+) Transcript_8892:113-382(+)|eukprot:CAMPEP_0196810594 /NCGR_PEP_ID=MMETSP1362-20130617/12156_1 /TAXON_ID=163516 /ORGANISM="Leptocylindrus danicus, Strain CCMP1856" /LENGTH=89 /DNA_ID=CAMNT_0042185667 /DNA_START=195 /DNA_END=464 /DNA_ORIENTATION=+
MPSVQVSRANTNLDQFRSMSDRHVLNGKSKDVDVDIKQVMRKNHRQHQSFKVHSSMTKAPRRKSDVLVPLDVECLNERWNTAVPEEYSR